MTKDAENAAFLVKFAGEATPDLVWSGLERDPSAALVDVRTEAEWSFVGGPDMSSLGRAPWLLPWRVYPGMARNESFWSDLRGVIEQSGAATVYMLCRSGARSLEAAMSAADALSTAEAGADGGELTVGSDPIREIAVVNVKEGFEGDLDGDRHRGRLNGWKARGLPWAQS